VEEREEGEGDREGVVRERVMERERKRESLSVRVRVREGEGKGEGEGVGEIGRRDRQRKKEDLAFAPRKRCVERPQPSIGRSASSELQYRHKGKRW